MARPFLVRAPFGLDRGFFEAGVQHVVMGLGEISDEATVDFMKDFYDAVYESRNAPLAIAQVQRKWLVKLRQEGGVAKAVTLVGPFIIKSKVR
jgi:CHAT domain-containing protein